MQSIILTSIISALAALLAAALTATLTRRREHDADWRKLKHAHYQEYVAALSGIVEGRSSAEEQRRYADALNGLLLVAPEPVLSAAAAFQSEISSRNPHRSDDEHDRLLNAVVRAMREDIHPKTKVSDGYRFQLIAPPQGASHAQ